MARTRQNEFSDLRMLRVSFVSREVSGIDCFAQKRTDSGSMMCVNHAVLSSETLFSSFRPKKNHGILKWYDLRKKEGGFVRIYAFLFFLLFKGPQINSLGSLFTQLIFRDSAPRRFLNFKKGREDIYKGKKNRDSS